MLNPKLLFLSIWFLLLLFYLFLIVKTLYTERRKSRLKELNLNLKNAIVICVILTLSIFFDGAVGLIKSVDFIELIINIYCKLYLVLICFSFTRSKENPIYIDKVILWFFIFVILLLDLLLLLCSTDEIKLLNYIAFYILIALSFYLYLSNTLMIIKMDSKSPTYNLRFLKRWAVVTFILFFSSSILSIAYIHKSNILCSYIILILGILLTLYFQGAIFKLKLYIKPICTKTNGDDRSFPELDEIEDRLILFFNRDKPYLDMDLKISDVAIKLYTNKCYLSKVLNVRRKENFKQFVNSYRVEEAKKIFKNRPNISIEELCEQSGFRSRATFISSFKLFAGSVPSEWCKEERRLNRDEDGARY